MQFFSKPIFKNFSGVIFLYKVQIFQQIKGEKDAEIFV